MSVIPLQTEIEALILQAQREKQMQAMIFAAGPGTRLKPLIDTMLKALVRMGGAPLLERIIRRLIDAGCSRMVVNAHHFANQIIDYLDAHNYGVDICVSDETEQLPDTGSGIKRAASLFDQHWPVLIHNVDILSNVDLAALYRHALETKADALLLVSCRVTQRYLVFDSNMRLVGWTNMATGEVNSPHAEICQLHFVSPTEEGGSYYQNNCYLCAFSGIHVLALSVLQAVEAVDKDKFPIMEFYLNNYDKLDIRGKLQTDLHLLDVGKLNSLQVAEDFIANLEYQNSKTEN